jgi:hypothetical protein
MRSDIQITHYTSLVELFCEHPWVEKMIALPRGPISFFSSTKRNEVHDIWASCKEINRLIQVSGTTLGDQLFIVTSRRIWKDDGIVKGRMGSFKYGKTLAYDPLVKWSADFFGAYNGVDFNLSIGELGDQVTPEHIRFLLRFGGLIISGNLDENSSVNWLANSALQIVQVDERSPGISIDPNQCLRLFPSARSAGLRVFGSDDFGGIFVFCFGAWYVPEN